MSLLGGDAADQLAVEVRRAPAVVVGAGVAGLSAALTLADEASLVGAAGEGTGRGAGRSAPG